MKRHLWAFMASTLIASVCLPLSASGQTVVPGQGISNWLQNWNQLDGGSDATTLEGGFTLPSGGNAIINGNRIVQVDSAINTAAGQVIVNNSNNDATSGSLEVNAGGSLSTGRIIVPSGSAPGTLTVQGGTLNVGSNIAARANGTVNVTSGELNVNVASGFALDLDGGDLNISGGTVTLTDPAPGGDTFEVTNDDNTGALNVSGGVFRVAGLTSSSDRVTFGNDVINISGGTFDVSGGQVNGANNTQFNIIGDAATIQMDRLNQGIAGRQSTFNFVFDSDGVSTINNAAFMNLSEATLLVDGSAYTGGVGSFDLFASPNLVGTATNVTVTGFGVEGVDFELVGDLSADGGNGNVTLNVLTGGGVIKGDVDLGGETNLFDIAPFIAILTTPGAFQAEADCDCNGEVNLFDIAPFIAILTGQDTE